MAIGLQNLLDVAAAWRMNFQTVHFLLFLPVVAGAYFVIPKPLKRPWLLLASYYFYFFAAPKYLVVLLVGTLFAYAMGRAVGTAKGRGKKAALWLGVVGLVLMLALFKYQNFFAPALVPLFARIGVNYNADYFTTAAAVGISFYTFSALGYLIDCYHGETEPEKNLLDFALFLGFFASITQGPINRAGALLPQLKDTSRRFSAATAADALRLMGIGFFKKLAVANMLSIIIDPIFAQHATLGGLTMGLGTVLFVVQLYFDFSGYTDIALGAAQLLGIKLPQNFQNPLFATNYSSFWARWHISLSSWLQDYIFTPLVWSRWTEKLPVVGKHVKKPPVLSSIAIVFLVSGLWHGDTLCFVIWGALQAVYRIGEELLHRRLGKPKKRPPLASRIGKTAVVLVLWATGLVFFKVGMMEDGTVADALDIFASATRGFSVSEAWGVVHAAISASFVSSTPIVLLVLLFTAFCTAVALWADWAQCFKLRGKSLVPALAALHPALKWAVYYLLVLGSFAGLVASGGGGFLYGGF